MKLVRSRLRKHWRPLAIIAITLAVLRLAVPCPLRGNWVGRTTSHMCDDHAFLRYADTHSLYYHGDADPQFHGTYDKVGWNTYLLRYYKGDKSPYTLHVGWLFMHMTGYGANYWYHRDFNMLEGNRMVQAAQARARSAREHIHLLNPGMPAPEVWAKLNLSTYRTPKRSCYITQDVYTVDYLLSPGEILHCQWAMTNTPPVLLKFALTGWPQGL